MLFHDMDIAHDSEIPHGRLIKPKVEAEVAFILGRDLEDERLTTADVIGAIAWAAPGLEIVESRIQCWGIRITDTIADNASSGLLVLGHDVRRLDAIDVCGCGVVLECDGKVAASGTGSACIGAPTNATHWLARVMARAGRPLLAGDVVLSGALGPMVSARPCRLRSLRPGIGAVSVSFGRDGSQ